MKKTKRILSFVLAVLMFVSLNSISFISYAEETGTEENPYLITTAQQLQDINNDVSSHYKLMADIDLQNIEFTPIGNADSGAFSGVFDGNGFTISNLNVISGKYAGLFGCNEGVIKNVTLENIYVYGTRYIGGICGENTSYGTLENCKVLSGNIESDGGLNDINAGGICGCNSGNFEGKFSNSADVKVLNYNTNTSTYAGGILGVANSRTAIENSYNVGHIYSYGVVDNYSGGIVGYSCVSITINECFNSGCVDWGAGIIAKASNFCAVQNSYNTGNYGWTFGTTSGNWYISSDYYAGSILGYIPRDCKTIIRYCYNSGEVLSFPSDHKSIPYRGDYATPCNSAGIYGGTYNGSLITVSNCYYSPSSVYRKINSYIISNEKMKTKSELVGWNFDEIWDIDSSINCGYPFFSNTKSPLQLDKSNLIIESGEKFKLIAYKNGSVTSNVTWSISYGNSTVNSQGIVTASVGISTITATDSEGNKSNCNIYSFTPASSVSVTNRTINISKGETANSSYFELIGGSGDYFVNYKSSNDSIVTVDSLGYLTPVSAGTATITATTASGLVAEQKVTVTNEAVSFSLPSSLTVARDTEKQIEVTVNPNPTSSVITWASSNNDVATVDQEGNVTGVSIGQAVITATTDNGYSDTCTVTVNAPVKSMQFERPIINIYKNDTDKLTLVTDPVDTTDTISYSSSSSYVSVSSDGTITAKSSERTVTITATASSGVKAYCTVNVISQPVPVTSVTIDTNKKAVKSGEIFKLTDTILPSDATNKNVKWSSTDNSIASVNQDGTVTAHGAGKAIITVEAENGLFDYCEVFVEGSIGENLSEIYIPYVVQENIDYVDVPVKIKNNPGINFASLNVKYDSNVLEPITVSNGEVFPFVLGSIEEESSIVKLLFSSEDNLTANGNLAVIRFKVLSEQFDNTQVSIYYFPNGIKNISDEAVSFNLNDGLVLDIEEHEHDFGAWVVTKEPTTTESGEETRTCSICGKTETREIPQIVLDKDTLAAAIEEFDNLNPVDYSTQSYSNLSIVVEEYRTVLQTAQSQQEIDDAVTAILEAMYDLVPNLNLNVSAENGSYEVQYDSTTSSDSKYSLLFGTEVTLTATANDGYKFVGWYDETSGVYLSKESTYTFSLTANMDIKAAFVEEQSSTLTFTTYSNWVKEEITKTVDEWNEMTSIEDLLPEVPYRYGYSNGRWVYDNEDVLAKLRAGENVSIVAEYDADDTSLPVPPTPDGDVPVLDLYYKLDEDENIGSFVMATGIPENCQIESAGMAFYYKNANQFNPENFELLLNNKMLTSTFELDNSNIYIANIDRFTSKNNWAARGYITYYDTDGNLKTVYSNQINIVGREQV